MISIQKKFLFIHVPKTGGNSIQNILKVYSEDDIVVLAKHQDGIERFEVRNKIYDIKKHSILSHYKSVLEPDTYESLFKFATIRNPWEKMISFYFSPHRGVKKWDRNNFIALLNNVAPLRHYVCEGAQSIKVDSELDYLIKFENLDEDFGIVCKNLGIPEITLPRRNQSNRRHYSKYYDSELIQLVEDRFKEEIEFGNYSFKNA
ncbi:sulfotransferase family 2 domain-containing protein [Amphritea sp. 1_MG-2023]|uniref:sulfotransferase family 2 domain-containing protein n=1 Tax=Amphritea sp. 1_MG-2023 TaxID=3062670 RepID=UPI0026E14EE5|nr:sulfotransferase family 2 domain-containing protein [Amphritea sp. 1_MG-2023]MDO6562455.1 sulfotransferase family 2 domain-containing protein [Amphritea sp. 1_MG-2023]